MQKKNEKIKMNKVGVTLLTSFLLFSLFSFLSSCATTSSGPDELKSKIREASDYLNEKIPAGRKIAFVSVQSDSAALTEYIIDELISNAVNDGIFSVVDRQQLDAAREELKFNWSGEVSDKSAQEVGAMLGAETIITGKISKLGDLYRFNIRAMDVSTVKMQASQNYDIASGKTINALMASGGSGRGGASYSGSGGESSSGSSSASGSSGSNTTTPAKPAGPANGTYTLLPRPQAQDSGVPVKTVFLAQIVYTDDFTVIYFADKAQGSFENGIHGTSTYCWQEWKTLQLQDLDNPSKFYTPVNGEQSSNGGGAIWWISFKRLPVKRFKLMADSWQTVQTFYEVIVPDQPDQQ